MICGVTGPPSAPTVSTTANDDFKSFSVMVGPPETSAVCVQGYVLNVTEDGGTGTTMFVDTSGVALVGDLNLCNSSYSFTASATTRDRDGDLSNSVQGQVNFSGRNGVIFLLLWPMSMSKHHCMHVSTCLSMCVSMCEHECSCLSMSVCIYEHECVHI